ncbi:MAG: T9SS type A sorting domain-containing protein [Bacteroidia bacterium]|jgi:hypothetical protein|nr:T9SS type A sorting domain-containing protein [Bacteroidia bacterium]
MKFSVSALAGFAFAMSLHAQVPKKVVVEHFTNTVCSVCASRNPGFNTNLNAQSGVVRLSIHPSSPYSSCVLNQHNVPDNDGRTNYYGVYGSTPRLVIQGVNIPTSANYSAASLFTPYTGQTTPASLRIEQTRFGNDSIRSVIIVKTEAAHTLGILSLFVALAEDTVFYNAPNGETQHYNVLRKALSSVSGTSLTLPANIGDSLVYTFSSPANQAWNFQRINTIAILQQSLSKTVVQAEYYPSQTNTPTSVQESGQDAATVYSTGNALIIQQSPFFTPRQLTIYDLCGREVMKHTLANPVTETDWSALSCGIYIYTITENNRLLKSGKVPRYN